MEVPCARCPFPLLTSSAHSGHRGGGSLSTDSLSGNVSLAAGFGGPGSADSLAGHTAGLWFELECDVVLPAWLALCSEKIDKGK